MTQYAILKKSDLNDLNDLKVNETLDLKNLSIFGFQKSETIKTLRYFISLYGDWISNQKKESENLFEEERKIAQKILDKQYYNLARLQRGISLLEDEKIFYAFQFELFFGRSALNFNVSKIQKGREKTLNADGDILYSGKIQLGDISSEKPYLHTRNNSVISNNPNVKIIHHRRKKKPIPPVKK